MKFVKYYRIQGGDGFCKSRDMLNVTSSNSLELVAQKRIHIGNEMHCRNFINLRLDARWKKYTGADDNKGNVNVIVMYFPEFFGDLLKNYAISEYIKTGKDPEAAPHTVDIHKGEAYALYGFWNLIMKSCNLYAENISVNSEKDLTNLFNNNREPSEFHSINIPMLKNSLDHTCKRAGISEQQINIILENAKTINETIKTLKKGEHEI